MAKLGLAVSTGRGLQVANEFAAEVSAVASGAEVSDAKSQ
jgi:hypothetical protein